MAKRADRLERVTIFFAEGTPRERNERQLVLHVGLGDGPVFLVVDQV
ncbi:MAG: hypothetical protein QOJ00_2969, partial [Actinomycetota bacterium]